MKIPTFMLPHYVDIKPYGGQAGTGVSYNGELELDHCKPNPDGSYRVRCRIEPKVIRTKDRTGADVVCQGAGYFNGSELPEGSIIIFNGKQYHVAQVKPQYGLTTKIHSLEVYFK